MMSEKPSDKSPAENGMMELVKVINNPQHEADLTLPGPETDEAETGRNSTHESTR